MIAHWRELMEVELPEAVDEVERLGGRRRSPIEALSVALTGGLRAGDEDMRVMSARRPILKGHRPQSQRATRASRYDGERRRSHWHRQRRETSVFHTSGES
jgi:hypothetical protein